MEIAGPAGLHRRANLWLRTASRVLLRLAEVAAPGEAALGRALAGVSLAAFRAESAPVRIEASVRRARLRASQLAALGRRAWPAPTPGNGDDAGALGVWLRLEAGRCTVSVDSSGELLHRRGYRQEISRAPMRETLAAGMLLAAGYRGDVPLWDPLCGSGTLAIEAALLALRRAPGLQRRFAFEAWPCHEPAAWRQERAASAGLTALPAPIWASDLHAGALGTARRNARRAGVGELLDFFRHDATLLRPPRPIPPGPGLVAANLPYGVRLGERAELAALYRGFGQALRALRGWSAALLVSGDPKAGDVERQLGWTPREARPLDNGGLRCRLLLGPLAA